MSTTNLTPSGVMDLVLRRMVRDQITVSQATSEMGVSRSAFYRMDKRARQSGRAMNWSPTLARMAAWGMETKKTRRARA